MPIVATTSSEPYGFHIAILMQKRYGMKLKLADIAIG